MDSFAHPVQARALVAQYRIPALFAGFPQGCLQFGRFAVGNVKHSLAFPDCAAAKLFHVFGEDDFVTAFLQQGNHFARQCLLHRRFLWQSHCLVDATGEINHFQLTISRTVFVRVLIPQGIVVNCQL